MKPFLNSSSLMRGWDFVFFLLFFALPVWGTFFIRIDPALDQWNVVYVATVFALITFFSSPIKILLTPLQKNLLMGLGGLLITNYFFHDRPFFGFFTLDRLCFLGLVLFFTQFFSQTEDLVILFLPFFSVTTLMVVTAYVYKFSNIPLLDLTNLFSTPAGRFSSVFGNPNITSQFLAISLVVQLYAFSKTEKILGRILLTVLAIITTTYIFDLHCKSIWIGMGAVVFLLLWRPVWISRLYLIGIVMGGFLLERLTIIFLALKEKVSFSQKIVVLEALEKPLFLRWDLLKASLLMLWKNPLGVGVNNFEFSSIPYEIAFKSQMLTEAKIARSPHCEYLRFLIEDGIFVCLLAAILGFLLIYPHRKKIVHFSKENLFFICLSILFGIEMLFQFPFELPFTFAVGSMITGYFFSQFYPISPVIIPTFFKTLVIGLLISFIGFQTWNNIIERIHPKNHDQNEWVCRHNPLAYGACFNTADSFMRKGQLKEAEALITQQIQKKPYNFIALRFWIDLQLAQNNISGACKGATLYDKMFFAPISSYNKFIQEVCRLDAYEKHPASFKQEYETFLKEEVFS